MASLKNDFTILYGLHPCIAAIKNPNRKIHKIFVKSKDLINILVKEIGISVNYIPIEIVSLSTLERLIEYKNVIHQGIVIKTTPILFHNNFSYLNSLIKYDKICHVAILDNITNPQNIGSILRNCAAFNIDAIITTEKNFPEKENSVLLKAASGAFELIPIIRIKNLQRSIEELKDLGFWIISLSENSNMSLSETLNEIKHLNRIGIVLGNEEVGIRKIILKQSDIITYIQTNSLFKTLNVGVASSISFYELFKKRMELKTNLLPD